MLTCRYPRALQVKDSVVNGDFPCQKKQAIQLAALIMQSMGPFNAENYKQLK